MPTTPKGYPYPTPDDPVSLGANDIKALAEANDARSFWTARGADTATPNAAWVGGSVVVDDGGTGVGRVYFGNPADTSLYRAAANVLKTDGALQVGGDLVAHAGAAVQATFGGDGVLYFGVGNDTTLYRNGASQLRTDGILMASQVWALGGAVVSNYGAPGQVSLTTPGGQPGVRFGTDTDLYRYQAGGLVIDGFFRVGGSGAGAEQSGLELFIDGAWRRVSRRSDGVMIC